MSYKVPWDCGRGQWMTDNPAKAPEPEPKRSLSEICEELCPGVTARNAARMVQRAPGSCMHGLLDCAHPSCQAPAAPAQVAPQALCKQCGAPNPLVFSGLCVQCWGADPAQPNTSTDNLRDTPYDYPEAFNRPPAAQPVSAPSPEIPDDLRRSYNAAKFELEDDDAEGWSAEVVMDFIERIGRAESALRVAREELAAMTEDRDLWRYDHEGDCPVQSALEAEREARKQAEDALHVCIRDMPGLSLAMLRRLASEELDKRAKDALSKPVSGSPERLEGKP